MVEYGMSIFVIIISALIGAISVCAIRETKDPVMMLKAGCVLWLSLFMVWSVFNG